jgi:hypothetical protein
MSPSYESGQRPLTNVEYQSTNNPYNSGAGFYGESSGFLPPQPRKKRVSNWIKFGIPILILIVAGAVLGGIFGSRASKKNNTTSNSLSNPSDPAAASSAAANKQKIGAFASTTDSYGLPVYPTNASLFYFLCTRELTLYLGQQRCLCCSDFRLLRLRCLANRDLDPSKSAAIFDSSQQPPTRSTYHCRTQV